MVTIPVKQKQADKPRRARFPSVKESSRTAGHTHHCPVIIYYYRTWIHNLFFRFYLLREKLNECILIRAFMANFQKVWAFDIFKKFYKMKIMNSTIVWPILISSFISCVHRIRQSQFSNQGPLSSIDPSKITCFIYIFFHIPPIVKPSVQHPHICISS